MSTKSTRSFCQKLVLQKNSGGSYIQNFVLKLEHFILPALIFMYRLLCVVCNSSLLEVMYIVVDLCHCSLKMLSIPNVGSQPID